MMLILLLSLLLLLLMLMLLLLCTVVAVVVDVVVVARYASVYCKRRVTKEQHALAVSRHTHRALHFVGARSRPTVGSSRGKGRNSLRSGISIGTSRRGSGGNSRVRSASREGRGPSTTWIGSVSDGIGNAAVAGGSVGAAQGCGHGGGSSSGDQSSGGGRGGGDRGGIGGGVGETGGETGGGGCGRDDGSGDGNGAVVKGNSCSAGRSSGECGGSGCSRGARSPTGGAAALARFGFGNGVACNERQTGGSG